MNRVLAMTLPVSIALLLAALTPPASAGPGMWRPIPVPSPLPSTGASSGRTFDRLLREARPMDAETLARAVLRGEGAPEPGTLVAIEIDRVTIATGPTETSLVVRVDAALHVPAYTTRLDPADPRSPIGPLLTAGAGAPSKIAPPDFKSTMTYALPGAAPAAEATLSFATVDDAAAFRLAHTGKLRAQLVLRPGARWKSAVLDPYERTIIGDDGGSKTLRPKGGRRDEVAGVACAVLGHRVFVGAGSGAGKVIASEPASAVTKVVSIAAAAAATASSASGAPTGSAVTSDSTSGSSAPGAAPGVGLGAGLGASPLAAPAPSTDLADCRDAHERDDFREALLACKRALAKNPLDAEASEILGSMPTTVTPEALRLASAKVSMAVRKCGPAGSEAVKVLLYVSPAGEITESVALAPHAGTPFGSCVAREARAMTLPPFAATASVKVKHVFAVW